MKEKKKKKKEEKTKKKKKLPNKESPAKETRVQQGQKSKNREEHAFLVTLFQAQLKYVRKKNKAKTEPRAKPFPKLIRTCNAVLVNDKFVLTTTSCCTYCMYVWVKKYRDKQQTTHSKFYRGKREAGDEEDAKVNKKKMKPLRRKKKKRRMKKGKGKKRRQRKKNLRAKGENNSDTKGTKVKTEKDDTRRKKNKQGNDNRNTNTASAKKTKKRKKKIKKNRKDSTGEGKKSNIKEDKNKGLQKKTQNEKESNRKEGSKKKKNRKTIGKRKKSDKKKKTNSQMDKDKTNKKKKGKKKLIRKIKKKKKGQKKAKASKKKAKRKGGKGKKKKPLIGQGNSGKKKKEKSMTKNKKKNEVKTDRSGKNNNNKNKPTGKGKNKKTKSKNKNKKKKKKKKKNNKQGKKKVEKPKRKRIYMVIGYTSIKKKKLKKIRLQQPRALWIPEECYEKTKQKTVDGLKVYPVACPVLIQLKKPLALSPTISPICLPLFDTFDLNINTGASIGYGYKRASNKRYSYTPSTITGLKALSSDVCQAQLKNKVLDESMFCTQAIVPTKSMCYSDEGAPFMIYTPGGKGIADHISVYAALAVPGCKKKNKKPKLFVDEENRAVGMTRAANEKKAPPQPKKYNKLKTTNKA